MAKKRCRKKGRRKCLSAFSFTDPIAYKLYAAFMFDGRTCYELVRQATAGRNSATAIDETISGYFKTCKFGPKFQGGFGTDYSVSLPDSGWFTFNNSLIPDSTPKDDLTGEITLVWRGSLHDDGNTLTDYQFIGKHASNGASANPFDLNCSHGGAPTPRVTRANGGFRIHSAPSVLAFETPYTIAFSHGKAIETAGKWYKDGQVWGDATLSGSGSGQATGGAQAIRIGRRADNALQMRGKVERILIYTRKLSAMEHWQLFDDPDVLFQDDDYGSTSIVAAATVTQPFTTSSIFASSFVRADAACQSGATFASTFLVVESRGNITSDVRFNSNFTPCISSDIYGYDRGDSGRYRR